MEIKDEDFLPCSPASRQREGNIPTIRPTKRQMEGAGYFSRKKARILATPINPITYPRK